MQSRFNPSLKGCIFIVQRCMKRNVPLHGITTSILIFFESENVAGSEIRFYNIDNIHIKNTSQMPHILGMK